MGWLVKAPARFILSFLLVWALIALLLVIDTVAMRNLDAVAGSLSWSVTVYYALVAALLPSVLGALSLQLMTLRRSSDHPLALRAIFLALSMAILVAAVSVLGDPYREAESRLAAAGYTIRNETIYRFPGNSLYVDEVRGLRLQNVVLVPRDYGQPMDLVSEGRHLPGPERELIQLPQRGASLSLEEAYGGAWRGPDSSGAFSNLLANIRGLTEELLAYPPLSRDFLLRAGAILFFVVAAWVFLRLTRWPLFNVFLFLLVVRGLLWLPQALESSLAQELVASNLGPELMPVVPYVLFGGFGAFLLLINVLLPSLSHWERETLGG